MCPILFTVNARSVKKGGIVKISAPIQYQIFKLYCLMNNIFLYLLWKEWNNYVTSTWCKNICPSYRYGMEYNSKQWLCHQNLGIVSLNNAADNHLYNALHIWLSRMLLKTRVNKYNMQCNKGKIDDLSTMTKESWTPNKPFTWMRPADFNTAAFVLLLQMNGQDNARNSQKISHFYSDWMCENHWTRFHSIWSWILPADGQGEPAPTHYSQAWRLNVHEGQQLHVLHAWFQQLLTEAVKLTVLVLVVLANPKPNRSTVMPCIHEHTQSASSICTTSWWKWYIHYIKCIFDNNCTNKIL